MRLSSTCRHAAIVGMAFTLLFAWLFARPLAGDGYLAEADLYEFFLPIFLAPITIWSSYEFGGMPAFADPQDTAFYPLHFLFARVIGSWDGFVVIAFVLAACFTYAYVYSITQSRAAAAFAGLALGLSEAMVERISHLTTLHAIVWLPLILLSIDRLRGPRASAWLACGAFAVASCVLGGHPQSVLYALYACGLYALIGGAMERADWRYYVRLTAMLGLGAMLTAVKTIPVAEASTLTARQSLGFAAFVSYANSPAQMLSMIFPTVAHEGREAPTYVGLATLVFALTAAWRPFRHWRIAFWLAIAIIALLIGVGDATPVAELAYQLPLYDKFRIGARHLILAAFALATLAGLGLAALQRGEVGRLALGAAAMTLAIALVAGTMAVTLVPQLVEWDEPRQWSWAPPMWNGVVGFPLTLGLLTAAACLALAWKPRDRFRIAALVVLLIGDLVLALPYDFRLDGLDVAVIPATAIQPSVHATRLAGQLAEQQQRLLAPAGTHVDPLVPAVFARVWRIPIAGGYGPMLLARYNALAMMGTNGGVDALALADSNTALDVLAVRQIAVHQAALAPPEGIARDGTTWSVQPMSVPVGRADCSQESARRVSYALPPDVEIVGIRLQARLRCAEGTPQGTDVATLRIVASGTTVIERTLTAGVDVADAGLSKPATRQRARHVPARVVDPDAADWSYLVEIDLPQAIRSAGLVIDMTAVSGWLEITRLSVVDSTRRTIPHGLPATLLNTGRWREAARFATSRTTDRGVDTDAESEQPLVVFENLRATPRAWIVPEVVTLDDDRALDAIHHATLPGGRALDPRRTAIVASEGGAAAAQFPVGPAEAVITSVGDGEIVVTTSAEQGGFLVLSEAYYPGWRARIDGTIVPVQRTYVALQGVVVPPGTHRVQFELVSMSLRAGAALSAFALGAWLVIVFMAWRRTS